MTSLRIRAFQETDLELHHATGTSGRFRSGVGDSRDLRQHRTTGCVAGVAEPTTCSCIAAVKYNPDYGFIGLFVVHPDHRGRGFGKHGNTL